MSATIVNGEADDARTAPPAGRSGTRNICIALRTPIETEDSLSGSWLAPDTPVAEQDVNAPGSGPLAALPTVSPGDIDRLSSIPATGPADTPHIAYEAELRHGYTLAHLNDLAVRAVRGQRFNRQVDFTVRLEIAWSAIAEFLYAADEPPARHDLIRAAWAAISDDVDRTHRAHGWDTHDRYAGITGRFQQYWVGAGHHTRSPEEPIVERVALSQIWPRLSASHRQLLLALAVYEDHGRAADALEKPRKSFTSQLSQARRAFLTLWHDGEQPSRPWGSDRRKGADSTDRHSPTYVIRLRERRRQAHVAAHGEPPPPRVRKGKPPADIGITVEELAHRYKQVNSIRALAASLGVSYTAMQRRMQAEGITRPTELTDAVRQRKRRRARRTATR